MLNGLKQRAYPRLLLWILGLGFLGGCTLGPASLSSLEPGLSVPSLSPTAPADLALPPTLRPAPTTVWEHLQRTDERLYVVLLRHALAPGTGDPASFQLGDCATQRNLSAAIKKGGAIAPPWRKLFRGIKSSSV